MSNNWTIGGLVVLLVGLAACSGTPAPEGTPAAEMPDGETDPDGEPATEELPPTETPPPFKEELVICVSREPDSLLGSSAPNSEMLIDAVTAQTAVYDANYLAQSRLLELVPSLEGGTLRRNEDGTLTATLHYRRGLMWSDGTSFRVEDALLGLTASQSGEHPGPDVLRTEKVDELTIVATMPDGTGYPYIPLAPPLPSHILGDADPALLYAGDYARLMNPTLGPYVIAEWQPGSHMLLQANPYYVDGPPEIGRVRVRFIPNADQIAAELQAGGCDVAADEVLNQQRLPALLEAQTQGKIRVYAAPGQVWEHVDFGILPGTFGRAPFFADVRVRQAVMYALDRQLLAEQATLGYSAPMKSWLPATHWAYAGDDILTAYPYDPAMATALLEQAGWADLDGNGTREYHGVGGEYACRQGSWNIEEGTPLAPTLITTDTETRRLIAARLQGDLGQVGINLQVHFLSPQEMFGDASRGEAAPLMRRDFDLALFSWVALPEPGGINLWVGSDVYLHPLDLTVVHEWQLEDRWDRFTVELLAPSNIPTPANDFRGQNYTGWCDETGDIAIVEAIRALNLAERRAFYAQQQAVFSQQAPIAPLFVHLRVAASAAYVCGIELDKPNPMLWNLEDWYFDGEGVCSR